MSDLTRDLGPNLGRGNLHDHDDDSIHIADVDKDATLCGQRLDDIPNATVERPHPFDACWSCLEAADASALEGKQP